MNVSSEVQQAQDTIGIGGGQKWMQRFITAGALVAILLFVGMFYKQGYTGVTDRNAIDIAQIAQNIEQGRGFTTRLVRPFNVPFSRIEDIGQPELNHGPLYPYALAGLFKVKGASDQVVAWGSLAFLLLTICATFLLGTLLFGRNSGLLGAAIFGISASVISTGISGQEWTMAALWFTLLLCSMAMYAGSMHNGKKWKPVLFVALGALMMSLLYATSYVYAFIALPAAAYFTLAGERKWWNGVIFLAILGLLCSPILYRNMLYTGSPVLGINSWDIMADTRSHPGITFYRSVNPDEQSFRAALAYPINHFSDLAEKTMRQSNELASNLTVMLGLVVLPFAVVSVLYKFKNPAANSLRALLYAAIPIALISSAAYNLDPKSVIVLAPPAAAFGGAYLLLLIGSKKLHPIYTRMLTGGFIIAAMIPAFHTMLWKGDAGNNWRADLVNFYFGDAGARGSRGVVYTDVPWLAAWRTECTCVWLPRSDSDIKALDMKSLPMRIVVLTYESESYNKDEAWALLHRVPWWREYFKDPKVASDKALQAYGVPKQNLAEANKMLDRLRRTFLVSQSIMGFVPTKADPLSPDEIQILKSPDE